MCLTLQVKLVLPGTSLSLKNEVTTILVQLVEKRYDIVRV